MENPQLKCKYSRFYASELYKNLKKFYLKKSGGILVDIQREGVVGCLPMISVDSKTDWKKKNCYFQ